MDLTPLIPIAISIGGAIGGAFYARKRGLPELKQEADEAAERLVATLKDQLVLANAELSKLKPQLAAAEVRIGALEREVDRLEDRALRLLIRIDDLERKNKNVQ